MSSRNEVSTFRMVSGWSENGSCEMEEKGKWEASGMRRLEVAKHLQELWRFKALSSPLSFHIATCRVLGSGSTPTTPAWTPPGGSRRRCSPVWADPAHRHARVKQGGRERLDKLPPATRREPSPGPGTILWRRPLWSDGAGAAPAWCRRRTAATPCRRPQEPAGRGWALCRVKSTKTTSCFLGGRTWRERKTVTSRTRRGFGARCARERSTCRRRRWVSRPCSSTWRAGGVPHTAGATGWR